MEVEVTIQLSVASFFQGTVNDETSTRRDDILLDENTVHRMWIMRKYLAWESSPV